MELELSFCKSIVCGAVIIGYTKSLKKSFLFCEKKPKKIPTQFIVYYITLTYIQKGVKSVHFYQQFAQSNHL